MTSPYIYNIIICKGGGLSMYIEELLKIFDDKEDINVEELRNFKKIVVSAGHEYLRVLYKSFDIRDNDILKLTLNGYYIEQSNLLSNLGIKVVPESYKESNLINSVTHVEFPINLFTKYKKEQVLKKVHK